MSQSSPTEKLDEIRRRLNKSQEVVVSSDGRLLTPNDQQKDGDQIRGKEAEKTTIKPQRWFNQSWYRSNPARVVIEQRAMRARFPQFELREDRGQLLWLGTLTTNRGNSYQVAVYYPDDYPNSEPKVFPIEPAITVWKDQRKGLLMHQFRDGSLCLFHPDDRFVQQNTTVATVVAVAAAWFFAYETWRETGEWPGIEAPHLDE